MEDKIREGDTGAAPKWTELEDLSQPSGSEPSSGSIRTSGRRIGGAALGTCIHRILELLPFEKSSEDGNREETMAFLLQSIKDMEERGTIQKEEADSIELSQLAAFLQSPLAVSYTHLDVYKRQVWDQQRPVRRTSKADRPAFIKT